MHEGFSPSWAGAGEDADGFGEVVLAHLGLKVGEGDVTGFGLPAPPVGEQADRHPPQHAQDPLAVGRAYPAAVVVERDVQPLGMNREHR